MKKRSIKNVLILFSLVLLGNNIYAQKSSEHYAIEGFLENSYKVFLHKNSGSIDLSIDSTISKNGKFSFEGNVKDVSYSYLDFLDKNGNYRYVGFFLEPGQIFFKEYGGASILPSGTFNNNLLKDFESQKEFLDSSKTISPYYNAVNRASEKLFNLRKEEKPDEKLIKDYTDSANVAEDRISVYMKWYTHKCIERMKKHPQTYFTAAYLKKLLPIDTSVSHKVYDNLGYTIQSSKMGTELKKELFETNELMEGTDAPNFQRVDINGHDLSLTNFKGKYVLLDFWATWCGPCRAANPFLIEMYQKYHNKGLEIIGIADDNTNIDGWKKAVKMDKTGIWHQVLRANGDNDLSELYEVSAYPTQYLIDKDGKIISSIEFEDLEKKLKELMP